MCTHFFRRFNDVMVCMRCGLTKLPDGAYMFDKKLINRKEKRNERKKNDNK